MNKLFYDRNHFFVNWEIHSDTERIGFSSKLNDFFNMRLKDYDHLEPFNLILNYV